MPGYVVARLVPIYNVCGVEYYLSDTVKAVVLLFDGL